MLRDAMSFSDRSGQKIRAMETIIDDLSWGFELYEPFSLKQGITFTLKNAGHILGSCFIEFTFPGQKAPDFCVTFSGDLGRTQELIYELDRLKTRVPVFIDSPLGIGITRLYQDMDDFWDKEAKTLKAKGDDPITFRHLYAVEKFRDHQQLLEIKGPAIIIAGSGMCTGGRIVNHLKHGMDDPKNDIFFVGYQAKGTPGRDILEDRTRTKAAIHRLSGYSAHADQDTLAAWVASMPDPPGEIRLVHGEPEAKKALEEKLTIMPIRQACPPA